MKILLFLYCKSTPVRCLIFYTRCEAASGKMSFFSLQKGVGGNEQIMPVLLLRINSEIYKSHPRFAFKSANQFHLLAFIAFHLLTPVTFIVVISLPCDVKQNE